MPHLPKTLFAGQNPLIQFDGLITTHFLEPEPGTSFQIKQTYRALPTGQGSSEAAHAYRGPPPHFHAHQTERFRVLKGAVGIEINEEIFVLRPQDGVAVCPSGQIHRFFVDVDRSHVPEKSDAEDDGETVLMVNATDSGMDFVLDRIFLENWYGIRVDSFKHGNSIDFIQQCATFDGGDHYLPWPATLPSWVSKSWSVRIRTFLGYWLTVVVGRYIGGLLGYTPFYREYTTDWRFAQAKMTGTWFYRRNLQFAYKAAASWTDLEQMKSWTDEKAAAAMCGTASKVS